jgi:hypothetical protein
MGRRQRDGIALLTLLAVGIAAYAPTIASIGWFSDDYDLVYGLYREVPTFEQSLRIGGGGVLSVHRLLCYPLIGYLGQFLGPGGAHCFQFALHLACGGMVFVLLRQLFFRSGIALVASALFVVSPLASQPVFWWSAVCTIIATLCILLAGIVHVRYTATRRRWLLPIAAGLALASLLFYELWLAGFLLLWGVSYGRVAIRSRRGSLRDLIVSFALTAPLLVPYVLWALLFKLNPPVHAHSPVFSPIRVVIVFASIHVRAVQQVFEWPTLQSVVVALRNDGVLMLAAMLAVSTVVVLLAMRTTRRERPAASSGVQRKQLVSRLLVAWSVFLASRLVFILQGGIATHSRHTYGAAIAAAIVVAVLFETFRRQVTSSVSRGALAAALTVLLLACGLSARGVALNYVAFSKAEHNALEALHAALDRAGADNRCPVFVIGTPDHFQGEFNFFSEDHGNWLRYIMHKRGVPRDFVVAGDLSEVQEQFDAARNCSADGPLLFRVDRNSISPVTSTGDEGLIGLDGRLR